MACQWRIGASCRLGAHPQRLGAGRQAVRRRGVRQRCGDVVARGGGRCGAARPARQRQPAVSNKRVCDNAAHADAHAESCARDASALSAAVLA